MPCLTSHRSPSRFRLLRLRKKAIALFLITLLLICGWDIVRGRAIAKPVGTDVSQPEAATLSSPIEPQTINGRLDQSSETMRDGSYYNTHTFEGMEGQHVTIEMISFEFDTYLILFAPSGERIAENDDTSNSTNSRITAMLPATGTYTLIANSYTAAETGSYTLSLRPVSSADADSANIPADTFEEAFRLLDQGLEQINAGEFVEALQSFEQALDISREIGVEEAESYALLGMGRVYDVRGQYPQALEFYQQALAFQRETGYQDGQGTTLLGIAGVYTSQGQYLQALDYYQQALANSRATRNRLTEGVALNNIGIVYASQGQYSQALDYYQQALAIRREISDRLGEGVTLINIGEIYSDRGQYQQALEQYQQALVILREVGDRDSEASTLGNIGVVYLDIGQYPRALEQFQQALAIQQDIGDRAGEGITLSNLGSLYDSLGQYPQALIQYQRALAIQQDIGDRAGEGTTLDNIGVVYSKLGQYSQALDYYQQALAIRRDIGDRAGEGVSLNNIGEIYRIQGQHSQALDYHQQALAIRREVGDRSGEGASLSNLALVYESFGQYPEALAQYQQALTVLREVGDRNGEGIALNNTALFHWASGNQTQALDLLHQAADLREDDLALILTIGSDAQKRDYIATLRGQTHAIVSFHLQATPDDNAAAKLALTTVLQRKGRVLDAVVDNLQTLRQNLTPDDQQLLDQLQETRSQLATLLYGGLGNSSPEQYRTQITELQTQAEQLENQLAQRSAEFRIESQPVTLEAVQQLIPADAALVEIVLYRPFNPRAAFSERWGNSRYAAYVLHQTGDPQAIDLGEADVIDAQVEAFRQVLQSTSGSVQPAARQLDQSVMQPVRSLLGDKTHILISPDSQLNLIPFAALVNENDRYLLEDYTFTYLTSGRDLLKLQNDMPSRSDPVLFANPDYAQPGNAEVSDVAVGRSPSQDPTQRSADLATLTFQPLAGTQTEVEAIAPLLPNATILTGTEATEATLKQLQAPSILHLATHGFFLQDVEFVPPAAMQDTRTLVVSPLDQPPAQENRPSSNENPLLRSGLALAGFNPRQGGGSEDGVLTALEVTSLNLQGTRMAVLSACETGVGDVANGEGVYGLRRAFVMAGAKSLMMSLWNVDDDGTSELMSRYYQRLTNGENRSEALRQVQLEFLQAADYRHPFYWAAFIFSGDWSQLN